MAEMRVRLDEQDQRISQVIATIGDEEILKRKETALLLGEIMENFTNMCVEYLRSRGITEAEWQEYLESQEKKTE